MTKIVLPQNKKDGLNGWQTVANVPEDQVVDILDCFDTRYIDCVYMRGKWLCDIDGMYEVVDRPKYWMAVKLPEV